MMTVKLRVRTMLVFLSCWFWLHPTHSVAQERIKIAYSSADASNTVWFTALDAGLYRKHGLDAELIFIQELDHERFHCGLGRCSNSERFRGCGGQRCCGGRQSGHDGVLH